MNRPYRCIGAREVIAELRSLMVEYGVPEHIRSDNGSEFIAAEIQRWMTANNIGTIYIQPGSPWENPYIESFNGKFRDECLMREVFTSILEARVVVEDWRREYNEYRPHPAQGGIGVHDPGGIFATLSASGRSAPSGQRFRTSFFFLS